MQGRALGAPEVHCGTDFRERLTGATYWDEVSFAPRFVAGRGALLATYEAEAAATRTGGRIAAGIPGFSGTGYFVPAVSGAVLYAADAVFGANPPGR